MNRQGPILKFIEDHQPLQDEIEEIYTSVIVHELSNGDVNWDQYIRELLTPLEDFNRHLNAHLKAEEAFLFPLVENQMEDAGGAYFTMDFEHKQIQQYLKQFISTVQNRNEPFSIVEATSLLTCVKLAYLAIQDHFKREEQAIFPIIEKTSIANA